MTEINNRAFNAIVQRAIASKTPETRRRAVNEALELLYATETLRKWALSIANGRGYRDAHGVHDVEQVIAEKILLTLRSATPEGSDRITDWLRFLHGACERAVKDYLSSSEITVASKMSGLMKRRDIIARTTKELTSTLGREPSREEIIQSANEWAYKHHKDARKQGLVVSDEDFASHGRAAVSLDESPLVGAAVESTAEVVSEANLALQRVKDVANELFPDDQHLLVVTAVWADCIANAERPSQASISKETGLSANIVRASLAKLNDVLDEVRDLFG